MRLVVVGATGTVGRALVPTLLAAGHSVVAVGRNPLLLEGLRSHHGVETRAVDLTDSSQLPPGDWLIDLTFPNRRHPRMVVRRAHETIFTLAQWLAEDPRRHVLHTGTFVVAGYSRPAPSDLAQQLTWDDSYVLAKSAAEQRIRQIAEPRIHVLRLGNVITTGSQWGQLVLRAASFGAVRDGWLLDAPANLAAPVEILQALDPRAPALATTQATAGATWRQVIDGVRNIVLGASATPVAGLSGEKEVAPPLPARARHLAATIAYRAGAMLPQSIDQVDKWRGWRSSPVVAMLERSFTSDAMLVNFPPRLPRQLSIAEQLVDVHALEAIINALASDYFSHGYGP